MGGLMTSAAGALSNCAQEMGSLVPEACWAGASRAAESSMAEWQIPQAEQVLAWWSCSAHEVLALSQEAATAAETAAEWACSEASYTPCMLLWACASTGSGACWCCVPAIGDSGASTPAAMAVPVSPRRTSTTINMK